MSIFDAKGIHKETEKLLKDVILKKIDDEGLAAVMDIVNPIHKDLMHTLIKHKPDHQIAFFSLALCQDKICQILEEELYALTKLKGEGDGTTT